MQMGPPKTLRLYHAGATASREGATAGYLHGEGVVFQTQCGLTRISQEELALDAATGDLTRLGVWTHLLRDNLSHRVSRHIVALHLGAAPDLVSSSIS